MAFSTMSTGSDGTLSITGVTLQPAGTAVTGATVTGTLKDSTGATVSGWNGVTLLDQGGGTYSYAFAASTVPAVGTYTFVVVITKTGLTKTVYHDVVVQNEQD
jgi:hypothetical protein